MDKEPSQRDLAEKAFRMKHEADQSAMQKPALMSINDACRYMGGISRAKFYADILPVLKSLHLDKRHMIVVASMDRLIESRLKEKAAWAQR
jgi:hypothetical protein